MSLSKSRFTSGLQCDRQLWWRAHEPQAPELSPGPALRAQFDRGHEVGARAREFVPGGILIDAPHHAYAQRIAATRRAIEGGARVLYEAAFTAGQVFVAVDILERTPGGWQLLEVKSGTSVKREHIPDAAIQVHVLRLAGLSVERALVMHLNSDCVFPRLENLFVREDVTAEVEGLQSAIAAEIPRQLAMLRSELPEVPIGPHCDDPHECPFKSRCWPPFPADHISRLYGIGDRWWDLSARGVARIDQLPDDFPLRAPAARQARALREGRAVFEPSLEGALASLGRPIAVLDFETVGLPIPVWNGCRPYEHVPVQFSVHTQNGGGGWMHREWLAEGPEDPRPELIARLTQACAGANTLLAYSSSFERGCLTRAAAERPELAGAIAELLGRLKDALPLVRDHVYHPDFGGGFGLKKVLPALVPDLSYESLEIADGESAQRELEEMLFPGRGSEPVDRERVRTALMRYCEMDTWGVARLLEVLEQRAASA
jgi:predicted RecB family nuclease